MNLKAASRRTLVLLIKRHRWLQALALLQVLLLLRMHAAQSQHLLNSFCIVVACPVEDVAFGHALTPQFVDLR
jgi:hypothetical protein